MMCGVQGFNDNADNYFGGWESIRLYLYNEKEKLGLTYEDIGKTLGVSSRMVGHWMTQSQWEFIPEKHYMKLQKGYKGFKKEYDELKKEYDELKKEYYSTRAYFDNVHDNFNNVWHFDRAGNEERERTGEHATPKPLALCARAIKSSSKKDDLVLDLFGGSGSTLLACQQTNRKCFMMELDEHYCTIILERYLNFKKNNGDDVYLLKDGKKIPYKEIMQNK